MHYSIYWSYLAIRTCTVYEDGYSFLRKTQFFSHEETEFSLDLN